MSGGGVYARMEAMARESSVRPVLLRQRIIEATIILASAFLLAYLLYAAQFSGSVRWFLGSALIAALAVYAWYTVARGAAEVAPLAEAAAPARTQHGELARLTAVVYRANQGLPYSQVALSSRARDAFEERMRLARGLTPAGMRSLERDEEALGVACRDPELADFVYLPTAETDDRYRWVSEVRGGSGFRVALEKVLDRMEEWR